MRRRTIWALLALATAGIAGFGVQRESSAIAAMQDQADAGGESTSTDAGAWLQGTPDAGEAKESAEAAPPTDTAKLHMVLRELHVINQSEIEGGRLASERAQAAEVKEYGQLLVRDHTEADRKLTDYAQRNQVDLTKKTPADPIHVALDKADKAQQKALGTKRGADFDAAFVAPQAMEHRVAVNIAEEGRKYAKDEARTLIDEMHRMLGDHLARAEKLQSQLRFEPAAVGGGPDGGSGEGAVPRLQEDAGTQGTEDAGSLRLRPPPVDGRGEPSE